ncbi:MAG TPA: undecaprenyl diphosphate synthase family protein, partial [Clostridia bacterium]|nr:undecaprenyl diphosphate synthase family protein [Clostridia bacterium]
TKRPAVQREAFQQACVESVLRLAEYDADLLIVGDVNSPMFPRELIQYTKRVRLGNGGIKVNFLVNYGWKWDLFTHDAARTSPGRLASEDISRIDLIVRWGGRRRLSGFLPVQSIYADFYIIDDLWPDFKIQHLYDALLWYQQQDITLGG